MGTKINRILKEWPKGTVATQGWLDRMGVSRQLAKTYLSTGWLSRFDRGIYLRTGDQVDWLGGLYAIQKQLGLQIHVGGKTALQFQGFSHYLPLVGEGTVTLFGHPRVKLPQWFRNHPWKVSVRYFTTNAFSENAQLGLKKQYTGEFEITVASPERAIMEVAYLVPASESLEEGQLLMEGLSTLRPSHVKKLLKKCRSVKTKRLFMYLAEESGHRWVNRLDLSDVDFGKGKRVIGEGGRFVSKYQISVPDY
jgi:hypothetical protein